MEKPKYFNSKTAGKIPLPIFFPDATKAVVRTLDSIDIAKTKTPGILVNTYHLLKNPGKKVMTKAKNVANFMKFEGSIISDSGGFQVMSLAKSEGADGIITDKGVTFKLKGEKKFTLTPEDSIDFQFKLGTDLMVVLDDFTPPIASKKEAQDSVERTILWAKRCKSEFQRQCKLQNISKGKVPYLIGVVQGGKYQDLRKYCAEKLVEIGFDGLGFGGWPLRQASAKGRQAGQKFDYETAQTIKDVAPDNYLLYGLGIGKPEEIVNLVKMGYHIFDCVLPTRDARHQRIYVYNAKSIKDIDIKRDIFYKFYTPAKERHKEDFSPVSTACDCLLCKNYSRAYLYHLFKEKEMSSLRLSSIHNLRFYAILMEKIRKQLS